MKKTVFYNDSNRKLTNYEKRVIIFFLKGIASELSKIIIFSILFYFLNLSYEFFVALFFLMLYRTSSGGLHCRTYIGCFFVSFLILSSGILLGITIFIPFYVMIIISLLMTVFGYILSPVQAKTRPPLESDMKKKAKQKTVYSITLYVILLCLFPTSTCTNIGFWLLVLHIGQLYIANKIRRYGT